MIQVSVQRMLDEQRADRGARRQVRVPEYGNTVEYLASSGRWVPLERDWWPDAPVFEDADDDE